MPQIKKYFSCFFLTGDVIPLYAGEKLWRGRGDVVILRQRQSIKEGNGGHARTFPEGGGRRWSSSGG